MPFARPFFSVAVVGALLWALSAGWLGELGTVAERAAVPAAGWDPSADVLFSTLVECLHDVSAVTFQRGSVVHPPSGLPNIEHWYGDRCRALVDAPRFRVFSDAYGLRATGAVRDILDREAELVALALDDPALLEQDVVAYWRAAAGRATADLDYLARSRRSAFESQAAHPLDPEVSAAVPPEEAHAELPR